MRPLLFIGLLAICMPLAAAGLNVSLVGGTTFAVPCDYTGKGNGFALAAFDINNPDSTGQVLTDITLSAIGSGNDSTAFSEVGLFVDSNSNGSFDPGLDSRYGQVYTAYPVDDGSLAFTESLGFAAGETKRFMVVGKLGGTVLPDYQDGFRTILSGIGCTGGSPTGVPTAFSEAAVAAMRTPTPLRLEYEVTGSGPPYDYTFRIVLDNHTGTWTAGQDWNGPTFGQAVYEAGGTAPFAGWVTDAASFPVGPFTTTPWWNIAYYAVNYNGPGLFDNVAPYDDWIPTSVGDQLVWWGTANTFLDEGEMTWSMARQGGLIVPGSASLEPAYRIGDYLRVVPVAAAALDLAPTATGGGNGIAIAGFDAVSHTSSSTLSSITVSASGSGDDSTAFSDIRLFLDSNGNGGFDPGVDTQFGANFSAYPADNGSLTFNGTLNFNPDETKRLLLVAQLNGPSLATFGQTFDTRVTAITATGFMHSGLPTAAVPGIHVSAPKLTLSTSAVLRSVAADDQGSGGVGIQAAEFLLTNSAIGTASLDSITVAAAGALLDNVDFSSIALYEDTNSSGAFDATDTIYASPATVFPGDDGSLTFSQSMSFAAGQSRRFFLVVKLSGSSQVGDDFWARIAGLGVSGGTELSGVPGALVKCLIVTSPVAPPPPGSGGRSGDSGSCSTNETTPDWLALAVLGALTISLLRGLHRKTVN